MKLGVRAHDFGRMTAAALAKTVKDAGFEAVQLAPTKAIARIGGFADITEAHLTEIDAAFRKESLEICVLGCYIEPSVADAQKRLEQVGFFKAGLANAKKLGVGIVGTETTHFDIHATVQEREAAYVRLKDSVLRIAEEAERLGVNAGIEPVAEHVLNTAALARRLLDEVKSDRIKIILDPVNLLLPDTMSQQAEIFAEFFDLLGDEIVALHLKDIIIQNGEKTWCKIGEGKVEYAPVFTWLHANKPDIRVLREGVQPDSCADDLCAMRRLIRR